MSDSTLVRGTTSKKLKSGLKPDKQQKPIYVLDTLADWSTGLPSGTPLVMVKLRSGDDDEDIDTQTEFYIDGGDGGQYEWPSDSNYYRLTGGWIPFVLNIGAGGGPDSIAWSLCGYELDGSCDTFASIRAVGIELVASGVFTSIAARNVQAAFYTNYSLILPVKTATTITATRADTGPPDTHDAQVAAPTGANRVIITGEVSLTSGNPITQAAATDIFPGSNDLKLTLQVYT